MSPRAFPRRLLQGDEEGGASPRSPFRALEVARLTHAGQLQYVRQPASKSLPEPAIATGVGELRQGRLGAIPSVRDRGWR
jgi:hypothetical protein